MSNYTKINTNVGSKFNISPAVTFTASPYGERIGLSNPLTVKRVVDNLQENHIDISSGVHVQVNSAGGLGCYLHIPLSSGIGQEDIRQIGWLNAIQSEVDLMADQDEIDRIKSNLYPMPRKSASVEEGADALSMLDSIVIEPVRVTTPVDTGLVPLTQMQEMQLKLDQFEAEREDKAQKKIDRKAKADAKKADALVA